MKRAGGHKDILIIRRFYCPHCESFHNELPDCLVPYKHYGADVISGVLDGKISQDDLETEDYPCYATMCRWKSWFTKNLLNILGYLGSVEAQMLGLDEDIVSSKDSLLYVIRNKYQKWLGMILRLIYNSGGFLVPVR